MQILKETRHRYLNRQAKGARNKTIITLFLASLLFQMWMVIHLTYLFAALIMGGMCVYFFARWILWRRSLMGEKELTQALGELDDSYYLVDNVQLHPGEGGIGHILLGPNGIFVIEAKNYSGIARCSGDDWYAIYTKKKKKVTEPVPSFSREAKKSVEILRAVMGEGKGDDLPQLQERLKPVVVFTNPNIKFKLHKPAVPVVPLVELTGFIRNTYSGSPIPDQELKVVGDYMVGHSRSIGLRKSTKP